MKKGFRSYFLAWLILLALFNVIAFVSPGWIDVEKYTSSFWIGYAFITVCFLGDLLCAHRAMQAENARKFFYNLPLITVSYSALIVSFLVGGACMLTSTLPYWIGVLVCAVVLALFALAVVKATAAADLVEQVDEKVRNETAVLRDLTYRAGSLADRAVTGEGRAACRKVYEALRYSDPVSSDALAVPEAKIVVKLDELAEAVDKNADSVVPLSEELLLLIRERNERCKSLK